MQIKTNFTLTHLITVHRHCYITMYVCTQVYCMKPINYIKVLVVCVCLFCVFQYSTMVCQNIYVIKLMSFASVDNILIWKSHVEIISYIIVNYEILYLKSLCCLKDHRGAEAQCLAVIMAVCGFNFQLGRINIFDFHHPAKKIQWGFEYNASTAESEERRFLRLGFFYLRFPLHTLPRVKYNENLRKYVYKHMAYMWKSLLNHLISPPSKI